MRFVAIMAGPCPVLCVAQIQPANVSLSLARAGAEAAVELSGTDGVEYLLEAANDSAQNWSVVSSFLLSDQTRVWREDTAVHGSRFFRARTMEESEARMAQNFRLIDQNGVSRELYYYFALDSLDAIVVVFAEGNYETFAPKIRLLRANPRFQNNVFFWTIETRPDNSRANIAREASLAGIDWPVMHDPLHLSTHDYKARFQGEAFLIRRSDMKILYRGLIDDAVGQGAATHTWLADALSNAVASQPILTTRVEPSESRLMEVRRPALDYSTVIAPLLQKRCVICHSPGNIAPFAMVDYQSVLEHAAGMKQQVMAGNMPPWHADPDYGKFKNNFSLTSAERATLIDWLDAGAPRAGTDDPLTNVPPPPSKWPAELGPPDQVITLPAQQIAATGSIPYRYIFANATNRQDHWLRAAVVRPSNRRVVHHYNVWEGRAATALVLAAYSPGRTDGPYPEGTGWLLRAQMEMTFNLHYNATGQEETDQPELGLWYASGPPQRALRGVAAQDPGIVIPAGNRDYEVHAQHTFPNPVRLYFVNPHMHLRGSRMRFELTVPGAPKRIIASIPNYQFHWQTVYHFDPPLDLPPNSRIDVTGGFDNSHLNHENPDPGVSVRWGSESWDEMFIGYMEYSDL